MLHSVTIKMEFGRIEWLCDVDLAILLLFSFLIPCLRAVVEVVPVVASTHPVIIGSSVVGLVVGVSGSVVQLAGLSVLAGSLGVQGSSSLSVKSLEHLHTSASQIHGSG